MVAKMQMIKERMDFMMNALRGWVLSNLDGLTFYCTYHFVPPFVKVSYVAGRSLRRAKGSLRSPRVIQNLDVIVRYGRRDHVSSLLDYAEGSYKGMIQQVST